jgi:hypothetical protein
MINAPGHEEEKSAQQRWHIRSGGSRSQVEPRHLAADCEAGAGVLGG